MFSSPARRRIIIVTTVVACLVATDVWVRRTEPKLRSYDVAYYDKPIRELGRRGVPDVVLMGSSRARYALVPVEFQAITGKPAYNAAVPGSKVVEWQILARRLFAEKRPALVVLGINASELRADYLPTLAARHLFTIQDLWEHLRHNHPSPKVVGNYLLRSLGPGWMAFHRRYELRMWCQERFARVLPKHAQEARELRERVEKPSPPDGYDHPWLDGRQLQALDAKLVSDEAQLIRASTPLFSPEADAFVSLGDMLDWFRGQHIAIIVAYIPNSPETERRWREVEPRMIDTIAALCSRHGVPFVPCSQEDIPRSNRDFKDETHVGLPLARGISDRVAQQICALGLLPDKTRQFAGTEELDTVTP